ncbi:hypothetical protein Tco_1542434, partial [Tanacetum coccineum]
PGLHSGVQDQSVFVTRTSLWQDVKNRVIIKPLQELAATNNTMTQDLSSIPGEHVCPANRGENTFSQAAQWLPMNHLSPLRPGDGKNKEPRNFADTLTTKSCQLQGLYKTSIIAVLSKLNLPKNVHGPSQGVPFTWEAVITGIKTNKEWHYTSCNQCTRKIT